MDDRLGEDLKKMQDAIHQGAMFVVGNSKDITALQEWQQRQNGTLREIEKCLAAIDKRIHQLQTEDIVSLRLELARGKPTWAIALILAFMSSLTVGAIVFALRVVGGI